MQQESIKQEPATLPTTSQQVHGYEAADITKVLSILNQITIQGSTNILYLADVINILAKPKYSLTPEDPIKE